MTLAYCPQFDAIEFYLNFMEPIQTPKSDPDGAKLRAWRLARPDERTGGIRSEAHQMFDWLLKDLLFKLRVGLIGAAVGAGAGAASFAYFGLDWTLGLIPGAALLGLMGFVFAIGPFRR